MTVVERVRLTLAEIERTDPWLRAWVRVDATGALADAEQVDARITQGEMPPLAGITVGVKDIFDVRGLVTGAGFAPFAGRVAARDAACVAALRAAGAVIVGKTVTTQFAVGDPPVTRNPWDPERTPGGSSSGSAAAVAAGHVDVALGSQTAGSTLRPAAYCGVVGFKPSFGALSRAGMLPLAATLDTVGLIARDTASIVALYRALAVGTVDDILPAPPRLGVWSGPTRRAHPGVLTVFQAALDAARKAGAAIDEGPEPLPFDDILAIHAVTMTTEAAAAHQRLYPRFREHYAPRVRAMVEVGFAMPAHAYARAQRLRERLRAITATQWAPYDAIILPTADTTAPTPDTTGNRAFQAPATLLGLPSISLPIGLAGDGLPVGLQLIAPRADGADALLRVARWVEGVVGAAALTPHPSLPMLREGAEIS